MVLQVGWFLIFYIVDFFLLGSPRGEYQIRFGFFIYVYAYLFDDFTDFITDLLFWDVGSSICCLFGLLGQIFVVFKR
jgi:hypothetical protein